MMSQKSAWIIVAILLVCIVLLGVGGMFYLKKPVPVQTSSPAPIPAITSAQEMALSFSVSPQVIHVGDTVEVILSVSPPLLPFAITTIELLYNPADLSVSTIKKGNLWSEQISIENKIDNAKGVARYTVAKDKTATDTGTYQITSFVLTSKRIGSIPIALGGGTLFVSSSKERPMEFNPKEYDIIVE
jgi:hypothetical protein